MINKKTKAGQNPTEIARECECDKIKVSDGKVNKIINDHNLQWLTTALTSANQTKRSAYAQAMSEYNWMRVLFSDEKVLLLCAAKTYAQSRETEKCAQCPLIFHVWAAVGT